jgi:hypothetical protein
MQKMGSRDSGAYKYMEAFMLKSITTEPNGQLSYNLKA